MHEILIGTIRIISALVILSVIARLPSDRSLGDPFFECQKWSLNDAYKLVIPLSVLTYLDLVLTQTLSPYASQFRNLISISTYCIVIYLGYRCFIKKPYGINLSVFGINRRKFLTTGIRHANIALIFLLLMILARKSPATSGNAADHMNLVAWLYFSTLIIAIFVGPLMEELLWRGVLYVPVARRVGTGAIFLLPIVHELWHLGDDAISTLVGYLFLLFLYYLYRKSRSLFGPIIWHISFNFLVNRSEIARVLAPCLDWHTLNRVHICGLVLGLLIINVFWFQDFQRRKRLQQN